MGQGPLTPNSGWHLWYQPTCDEVFLPLLLDGLCTHLVVVSALT